MSFDKLNYGRIFLAIGITFFTGMVVMVGLQACVLIPKMAEIFNEIDPNADAEIQQEQMMDKWREVMDDYMNQNEDGSSTINVITAVDGALTALVAFFLSFRTARRWATSPQQAISYGLLIGSGITMTFGMCVVCSLTALPVQLIVLALLFAGAFFGGQFASQNLALGTNQGLASSPERPILGSMPAASPLSTLRTGPQASPQTGPQAGIPSAAGAAPDVYYTMGVQAALGGRREEAQQHFKRVLQGNPRHVAAWLQLANLAASPEEAWNYVQQARSIDATDPAVIQAVNVIWPQVAARAQQPPPDSDHPAES